MLDIALLCFTAGSVVDCGSRGERGARRGERAGRSIPRVCSHDSRQSRAANAHAVLAGGERRRSLRGLLSIARRYEYAVYLASTVQLMRTSLVTS